MDGKGGPEAAGWHPNHPTIAREGILRRLGKRRKINPVRIWRRITSRNPVGRIGNPSTVPRRITNPSYRLWPVLSQRRSCRHRRRQASSGALTGRFSIGLGLGQGLLDLRCGGNGRHRVGHNRLWAPTGGLSLASGRSVAGPCGCASLAGALSGVAAPGGFLAGGGLGAGLGLSRRPGCVAAGHGAGTTRSTPRRREGIAQCNLDAVHLLTSPLHSVEPLALNLVPRLGQRQVAEVQVNPRVGSQIDRDP